MDLDSDKKKDFRGCCDYCLSPLIVGHHGDKPGISLGCHETFADSWAHSGHIHKRTGGCKNPREMEDYYRKDGVWYRKEPPKDEDIADPSPNSSRTRGVAKRSTSKGFGAKTSPDDRLRGLS